MSYFTITTTRAVADKIIKQCHFDEKMGDRTYKLGKVEHELNYSVVQILRNDENVAIKAEDIFWLGHFSNSQRI